MIVMKAINTIFLILITIQSVSGQVAKTERNNPTWDNISWMTGEWIGDGFGGISYGTWSAPINDIMLGTYRHTSDGKNNFFELFTIAKNEEGQFEMKLRHFNPDMTAWEDKEGQLIWPLKSHAENKVTFGPCTYELIAPGKMKITLLMDNDGKQETEIFNFTKQ